MDPQPPLTPAPPAAPPDPAPPPAVPTPVDPPVPPETAEPGSTPPTTPQTTTPQSLNPTEWFKEDTPAPKPPLYAVLLNRIRSDKRILFAALLLPVLLLGGGAFGYVSLRNTNEKPSPQAGSTTTTDQQNASPVETVPTNEPESTPSTPPAAAPAPATTKKPTTPSTSTTPAPAPVTNKTYTMTYTNSCYTPSTLAIKKGDIVKFVNESNKDMWPASDDHPQHTDYSEFDANRDIEPGGSYSFTFNKTGTWGVHDHNKPSCTGTITVS